MLSIVVDGWIERETADRSIVGCNERQSWLIETEIEKEKLRLQGKQVDFSVNQSIS